MPALNRPLISVIAPAHNEAENIDRLVEEVGIAAEKAALVLGSLREGESGGAGGFEFIVVDDGSTDDTRALLLKLSADRPWLRVVAMTNTPPGKGNGQSAAFHAGFRAARADLVATLDADLQNDPADLVQMAELLIKHNADMVQGDRSRNRRDNFVRRWGSWVGRTFRRALLGDTIRDTGCSLRLFKREIALRLPLEFKGIHRFIPASARHMGYTVVEMPVNHRERHAGTSKYGMGITKRAIPGLLDLFAVRWMRNRRRPVTSIEATPDASTEPTPRVQFATRAGRAHADR
ncbi:MAG: glycosyltransferase family 2 protein [Phycisphaerales bacterium]|nr:glycosyltransferase family 2 protein [Phycisphaerales bacterium]